MKRQLFVLSGVVLVLGLMFISCQKQESVQQKTTPETGVAVQTYDKAVETMDMYKQKGEEAIEQMKESAAGYGEAVKDTAAGYGEQAEEVAAGYGQEAEKAIGELGTDVEKSFKFK